MSEKQKTTACTSPMSEKQKTTACTSPMSEKQKTTACTTPMSEKQETTACTSAGVPTIASLPPELLEAIFVFLDVATLCTARLVCAQFHGTASWFIRSVKLSAETVRSRPETTLSNFPNLSRVDVFKVEYEDLLMLAESRVADAVTHLWAVQPLEPLPERAQNAAGFPFPNLACVAFCGRTHDPVFPFPQTLRELYMGREPVTRRTVSLVAGLTNLTCLQLHIDIHRLRKPFEAVTALTALQKLTITCSSSLVPYVAELTLLTSLQFHHLDGTLNLLSDWAPVTSLSRLHRLVHLGVYHPGYGHLCPTSEPYILASLATFTGLRSLDLDLWRWPEQSALETASMMGLSQLTALRLVTPQAPGVDVSFLPRFNLERLQVLSLSCGVHLDLDSVAALRRATGLTHLKLGTTIVCGAVGHVDLGLALPLMSRLRALSLGTPNEFGGLSTPDQDLVRFSLKAIALLTELTRLELSGWGVITNANMEVCLGLKKVRVLCMTVPWGPTLAAPDRITPETFFAMAKLPELRKFKITGSVGISKVLDGCGSGIIHRRQA